MIVLSLELHNIMYEEREDLRNSGHEIVMYSKLVPIAKYLLSSTLIIGLRRVILLYVAADQWFKKPDGKVSH